MPVDEYIPYENGTKVLVRDNQIATFTPLGGQGTQTNPTVTTPAKGSIGANSGRKTVTGAASTALAANTSRKSATFQNVGTVDIWLRAGNTAAATDGFKLEPGKSLVDDVTTGLWSAFVASGSGALEVLELV